MPGNIQKTPISRTLNTLIQRRAVAEIVKRWAELPCTVLSVTGAIVTVNFDVPGVNIPQATMPIETSKYARAPIQAGDKGIARTASAYIGQVSGLGTGSPGATSLQPNLANLTFCPVGNDGMDSVGQDYVITDATGASVITVSPTGITLAFGGKSVVINSSGVTIDGILFDTHIHSGVTTGGDDSGPPVP